MFGCLGVVLEWRGFVSNFLWLFFGGLVMGIFRGFTFFMNIVKITLRPAASTNFSQQAAPSGPPRT